MDVSSIYSLNCLHSFVNLDSTMNICSCSLNVCFLICAVVGPLVLLTVLFLASNELSCTCAQTGIVCCAKKFFRDGLIVCFCIWMLSKCTLFWASMSICVLVCLLFFGIELFGHCVAISSRFLNFGGFYLLRTTGLIESVFVSFAALV